MKSKTVNISGFPLNATANAVTEFLERHTGDGSVVALKLRPPKVMTGRSTSYAMVQFTTTKCAEDIIIIGQRPGFHYGGLSLKIRDVERDIVPNPRKPFFELEDTILHFGCPTSQERLSVIWTGKKIKVQFGFNMKKICFFLSWEGQSYKLELSYESIWEFRLHRSCAQRSQFVLIQVVAAPRIYKLALRNPSLLHENPLMNYFKELPDDQWIRTTDFTHSCSIGQSSALCLQLPHDCILPNIREHFFHYKEFEGHFDLESIPPYSRSLDLVPIVEPSNGLQVPYKVLFKINVMVQNGTLMGPTLDDTFFKLVSPLLQPIGYIERALEKMSHLKSNCFDPAKWLRKQYLKFEKSNVPPKSPSISLDAGLVYVHRVQVTPSKVYFYGPEINVSNRVLRHYSEDIANFVRVSFVDEDGGKMRSIDLSPRSASTTDEKQTEIYRRILHTLRNGITVGNKKFEFLAFSSSQLRENSMWMYASRNGVTAADIRKWMGDFHEIRNVAKYAARLGQSFSSSTETLTVGRGEVERIPDIEFAGYVFSDGIGKISAEFARRVAVKCGLKSSTPSAFQIRYGGYKGVVAVDPASSMKLSLRKSMSKYKSENTKLDVLAYSRYQPCFLNRQLISLLSTLGVGDSIFEMKQEEVVDKLDKILTDPARALEAIQLMSPGETTNVLKEMLLSGFKPDSEPFLSMMLQTFRTSKLFELRTKSRIFVPKGRAMMGCLDETGTLEYGQVFVQVSCTGNTMFRDGGLYMSSGCESDRRTVVVTGRVVVAKNPCLHPGDVRVLSAVDVPDLHHMVDCVVFPQKGHRPHPNECSGSDLDGDTYFVTWDPVLIPSRQVPPMDYTPARTVELDHDVTIEEVQEYFTNYIVNDSLGVIANAHSVYADKEPRKAESEQCLELARLFSVAVDFPKTGVAAVIPPHLHVKEYPDFMEKLDKETYESKGVIGKLFRAIKDHATRWDRIKAFTKDVARRSYDPDMEVQGFEEFVDEAFWLKDEYDFKLGNLMDHYGRKAETEILGGGIMKLSKNFGKNKDGEALGLALKSLRNEARKWFNNKSGKHDWNEDSLYAKASAWYHVTYHPDYWGRYNEGLNRVHYLSFPWCVYDRLITIKQRKLSMKKKRLDGMAFLQQQMQRGLRLG